jgi:sortase A
MPEQCVNRVSRPLRWLERLFLIAGAAALIWCAVIVADGAIAQRNAQSALEMAIAIEELRSAAVGKVDVPSRHPPGTIGAAIAALSIPRVQLSSVVLHGSDARTLQRGPGHLEQTALPGEAGNIVIAGHRDSFFRPLRHIRLDDDIFLQTRDGQFHQYRVTTLRVVGPHEVSVIAPTTEEVLTLITCYPFWVLGHAPDRFIVRAARVDDRTETALAAWSLPVRDWLEAPALHRSPPDDSLTRRRIEVHDDEGLVRQAVRRYLIALGVQPITCAVSVTGDRASADCESVAYRSAADEQPRRVFALERSNSAWVIRSIVLTERPARESQEEQP